MQAFLIPLLSTAAIKMIIILWFSFSVGKLIKTWIDLAYLILRGFLYIQLLKTMKLLVYVIPLSRIISLTYFWQCTPEISVYCIKSVNAHTRFAACFVPLVCTYYCSHCENHMLQHRVEKNIEFTSPSHASKHPNIFSDRIVTKALLRS